jgi:hypothetical protein
MLLATTAILNYKIEENDRFKFKSGFRFSRNTSFDGFNVLMQ